MKKHVLSTLSILVLCSAVSAFAGVTVSSPTNNSTVNGSVYFKATASTDRMDRRSKKLEIWIIVAHITS